MTPEGYIRNDDGVLEFAAGIFFRRQTPKEAVFMRNGHGDYFGCMATVWGQRSRSHFCSKKAKHDPDANGNPTRCGIHSTDARAKRGAKPRGKWAAESAARSRVYAISAHVETAHDLIRQIAADHNDPRAICQEWLDKLEELKR